MSPDLKSRAQALIDALIDGDPAAVENLQGWLMGECAAGLLNQDGESLAELRAAVADLAPVADRYGPGKPGDRWRAVWELLHAIGQTSRPLEQIRLARPERVSGQLLRLIRDQPGIAPGEMAKSLGKQANHVSNALRGLIDQGLVHRVARGREVNYYLSETGREALVDETPAQETVGGAAKAASARESLQPPISEHSFQTPHADPSRLPPAERMRSRPGADISNFAAELYSRLHRSPRLDPTGPVVHDEAAVP
jgi:hypothetical protein